jgi:hypothetical protein
VYDQWTRFEEFPLFLEGVEEVRLDRKIPSVEGEDRGQNQKLGGRDYEPSPGPRDFLGKCGWFLSFLLCLYKRCSVSAGKVESTVS